MSQLNILDNSLVTCPNCIKVLNYYDYLSHIEICNEQNSDMDDMEIQNYNEENIENIDNDEENNNNFYYNTNININNYSRMVTENLYNPLLNRDLDNTTNIIINNTNTTIDIGLGIENLSLYSTKIPINNESYCVICMNTNINNKNTFYLMKCLHSFCENCSKRWFDFKSVCPLCKTNMKTIKNI